MISTENWEPKSEMRGRGPEGSMVFVPGGVRVLRLRGVPDNQIQGALAKMM